MIAFLPLPSIFLSSREAFSLLLTISFCALVLSLRRPFLSHFFSFWYVCTYVCARVCVLVYMEARDTHWASFLGFRPPSVSRDSFVSLFSVLRLQTHTPTTNFQHFWIPYSGLHSCKTGSRVTELSFFKEKFTHDDDASFCL